MVDRSTVGTSDDNYVFSMVDRSNRDSPFTVNCQPLTILTCTHYCRMSTFDVNERIVNCRSVQRRPSVFKIIKINVTVKCRTVDLKQVNMRTVNCRPLTFDIFLCVNCRHVDSQPLIVFFVKIIVKCRSVDNKSFIGQCQNCQLSTADPRYFTY